MRSSDFISIFRKKPASAQRQGEISPARVVLFSFAGVIVFGTIMLCLPLSSRGKPIAVEDALFTATSAVCVTGLAVADTEKDFSTFGQAVILFLIQLGGLGIMTYSTFFLLIFRRGFISQSGVLVLSETLTTGQYDVRKVLFAVFKVAAAIELWGILLLFLSWKRHLPADKIWWHCVFHAISAFCNAGFSTFSENLVHVRHIKSGCAVIMGLIVMGGLGFTVLESIFHRREYIKAGQRAWPLQTKIVLAVSSMLIVLGALLFWILDAHNSLGDDPFLTEGFHALFQSISARTAGYNTVNIAKISHLGIILLVGLMFIGGSPGSCAGGIKTTTIAIVFGAVRSLMRNPAKTDVVIFKRRIPDEIVNRAFIIAVLAVILIMTVTVLLTVTEAGRMQKWTKGQEPIFRLLFETVSAFGTVGLSTGITRGLSVLGKLLLTMTMFIGRVGPLTAVLALAATKPAPLFRYPEEKVMVG
ncbi:MAG TPA: potassium transporter TrkG [Candidatus Sumerlaeia bacterium]|nr:potassium transporter TrkG [Candidatus Sumerlaeia bacterium]